MGWPGGKAEREPGGRFPLGRRLQSRSPARGKDATGGKCQAGRASSSPFGSIFVVSLKLFDG